MHTKLISICSSVTKASLKNAQLIRSNYDKAALRSTLPNIFT